MPVPDEEIMDLLEQATEIFATLGMELTGTKTGHQKDVIFAFFFSGHTNEMLRIDYDLDWDTGEVHFLSATKITLLPPE